MDPILAGEPPDDIERGLAESSPTVHRWRLTDPAEELGNVRAWAGSLLAGQDHDRVADAVFAVDSVVTGACSTECGPSEIRLTILTANLQLLIEVDAHEVPPRTPFTDEVCRLLLDQTTVDWGIRRQDSSQTIWAAVDLTA